MTDEPEDDYEVGYGKTPIHTRFGQPGVKGNPHGRPRGSKTRDTVERFLHQPVAVTKNGIRKRMPLIDAVLFQLGQGALAREPAALNTIIKLLQMHENRKRKRSDAEPFIEAPPGAVVFIGVKPGDENPDGDG